MAPMTMTQAYTAQPQRAPGKHVNFAPLWRAIRQAAARWALVAVAIAMVWLGRASTNARMRNFYRAADLFLAYIIIDPFLVAPLMLMGKLKHEAKGNYRPLALEEIPASLRETERFTNATRDLERLGFEPAGYAWRRTKHVLLYTETFIHPRNYDGAAVAFAQSALRDQSLVTIWTRFDDGTSLDTSNYPLGGLFRQDPRHPIHRFPQLQNVADLYEAHRALHGRRNSFARAIQLKPEMMIGMLDDATERALAYQAQQGDLVLGASGEMYSYTWKGAWRHAALNAWWVKPLRRIRNEMRAASELRELGMFSASGSPASLRPELDNRPLG
jgi:hypothetical protein